MDNKMDIREIAQHCKNEYEQRCQKTEYMSGYSIHYVAITDGGKMRVSKTPHILDGVDQCYLIHSWSQKAVSCWYETYAVQSINVYGEVGSGNFDDEYSFSISAAGFNRPEMINLRRDGNILYSESLWNHGAYALGEKLQHVWDLYNKCRKECKTHFESELLCELASKNDLIKVLEEIRDSSTAKELFLKEQICQYRSLLDEIKSALKKL
jgi:hypothetical protein